MGWFVPDKLDYSQPPVPLGTYDCEVVSVTRCHDGQVKLRARITAGPEKGKIVTRQGSERDPEIQRLAGDMMGVPVGPKDNIGTKRYRDVRRSGRRGKLKVVPEVGHKWRSYTIGDFWPDDTEQIDYAI